MGIHLESRNLLENAATPTRRAVRPDERSEDGVHAMPGSDYNLEQAFDQLEWLFSREKFPEGLL